MRGRTYLNVNAVHVPTTGYDDNDKLAGKMAKMHFCYGNLSGQAQVQPIDKLDEACTNVDDRMMLVQHCGGDRVMS